MANILIFGDSITQGFWDAEGGWVTKIRKLLDKKSLLPNHPYYISIFNLGVSGNTTVDLLKRFEPETIARLDEDEENIIGFAIGINDSCFFEDKKRNNVDLNAFKANLQTLLKGAQKYSKSIFFVGLTPVQEEIVTPIPWSETKKSYKNLLIEEYDNAIKNFAKANNLIFIDILKEFKRVDYKNLLEDGLHPNTKGHELIFKVAKPTIFKLLKI